MTLALTSLRLLTPKGILSPKDYIIQDGMFVELREETPEGIETIDCSNFLGSKGWIDLRCMSGEPGEEYKESLDTLGRVLEVSGFAKAVVLPNNHPVTQTKNEVEFLKSKAKHWLTELILHASVTKDAKGEDFTDILDLHAQGVLIFGDGIKPLSNPDRLMKTLQYLQKFDGILFDHSYDPLIALFGQMHEGAISTQLGFKGLPNLAEDISIQRNLEILRYTGGRLHFQTINTAKAVELIRQAKKEGLQVTADISIYQLIFSDTDLMSFDSNFKVVPPLRGKEDREALIEGLKDGTIDALVSNHQPQDLDSKQVEFDYAHPGMIGLQTFLPALVRLSAELSWELLIEKITTGPARVLGLPDVMDTLTIFDPAETWDFNARSNESLSFNHPWWNTTLQGKVKYMLSKGVFNKI
ncbi:dihydroorotase [Mongoliitalea daihaiensis]|uniref:dihydroorotase n=1 Tax=Mongoliitalea daihaiensis TaxID=2782006 RepID=UPI001F381253|nr:dihydroorotase [Mongoliitalea daihaiensis]UJP66623.1 dihydroorotase [Mongoliitalea daihaiensis]